MVPCRIAIQNLFVNDSQPRTPRQVIETLRTTIAGEWTDCTIRAHLIGLSTNHPSAHHYPHLQTFALARGFALDDEQALAVLSEWNARCEPPWTTSELLDKLRRAARSGREPVGGLL